ncbi:MAG: DNA-directed RNA polymerase subunit alpha [bacterium]|nr:DNA-directed RNA polymerase subunit alpha [bacterium]MDO8581594.1 DNA-directed RNA polymerase subunit alpha [bacterium]
MPQLHLPTKIFFEAGKKPTEGQLIVEPCEAGFGTTLGNALRRVLLSSLPGAAVTDAKIKGASHEFSTLPGVKEDVVEILLNLKQLRLKVFSDEPVRLMLKVSGEKNVTAGDIEKDAQVEIANPKLHLATLTDKDAAFEMELIVGRGRGYDAIESRENRVSEIGLLAVDALYTPIRNVGFRVDHVRVGQMTNYDRLTLTVETDGTISGQEAVEQSAKILIDHFSLLTSLANAPLDIQKESEPVLVSGVAEVIEEKTEVENDEQKKEKKKKEEVE